MIPTRLSYAFWKTCLTWAFTRTNFNLWTFFFNLCLAILFLLLPKFWHLICCKLVKQNFQVCAREERITIFMKLVVRNPVSCILQIDISHTWHVICIWKKSFMYLLLERNFNLYPISNIYCVPFDLWW